MNILESVPATLQPCSLPATLTVTKVETSSPLMVTLAPLIKQLILFSPRFWVAQFGFLCDIGYKLAHKVAIHLHGYKWSWLFSPVTMW